MKYQIGIIGSGNWGSTISKLIGQNVAHLSDYEQNVMIWVKEELVNNEKLSHIINTKHENPKYLPGVKLPKNVIAVTDILSVVSSSTHLIFVIPHQFIVSVCEQIKNSLKKDAIGISLIKGLIEHESDLILPSSILKSHLNIHISILSGANIASEIAAEKFSTSTIGCDNLVFAQQWKDLFSRPYFKIDLTTLTCQIEIVGALKNCVALGIGFCEALEYGINAKASAIRVGFQEIIRFVQLYYPDCQAQDFLASFGLDDLIATCFGGRNVRAAEVYIRVKKTLEEIERDLLNGQKLQGPATTTTVYNILKRKNQLENFPFLTYIYHVLNENLPANKLIDVLAR